MRSAAVVAGALAPAVLAATTAKNVIYIVPDGYGQASQTMARDYVSLIETGTTPRAPSIFELQADQMVRGLVRTHASNNLITDSAASGTAFACGFKSYNNAIGITPDFQPVGSILEAAKLAGLKTGLVDLFGYAEDHGYHVMQNRDEFDALKKGLGDIRIPFIGLFNDDQLKYEMDRKIDQDEPSLLEMVETSLNALHRATHCKEKGYFIMIEASRIDHAGHANDAAAHVHETIMYNDVMGFVREWIDEHDDTVLMSAADHECGGLTLNGFNPLPLQKARRSREGVERLWSARPSGADRREYLVSEILPEYGLADASSAEITSLLAASNLGSALVSLLRSRAGVNWSTGGHTASDVTLFGYAAGDKAEAFKGELAGHWDNTELPRIAERVLGVDMDEVTKLLRANGTSWVTKREFGTSSSGHHTH
ncbi:alkaline phosphatase [Verticillium dahliae VdLs.17]|uniref:Alkaline phosphatase n=1 Tax=Verticillium dahliae (strain VdLs.17 / ATCC MYA-4575 / FGSC 10137) TaxID=498257 RepID=G2WSQ0_VERDV|nr:alkaline phosphatase [Verticillium dahliae VdLs.17]EGY17149.1 alkaline phosphatase [Verticillium dahliae VdLs.17]